MTTDHIGCGDNSCVFRVLSAAHGGMGTNGGCQCFKDLESWIESEQRWNRTEVRHVERSTRLLAQEVLRLRNALAAISLDEYESTSGASEKVHGHARIAREALYGKQDKP